MCKSAFGGVLKSTLRLVKARKMLQFSCEQAGMPWEREEGVLREGSDLAVEGRETSSKDK